jgi:hypothetical protein
MSYHCIVLDRKNSKVFAIADKRVRKVVFNNEALSSYEILNDDHLGLIRMSEKVYSIGGAFINVSERFRDKLLDVKGQKPSGIIKYARSLNREIGLKYCNEKYNQEKLFGIYDDGRLFMWTGEGDGSDNCMFCEQATAIFFAGGIGETLNRSSKVLFNHLNKHNNFPEAMVAALKYASSIDDSVSPTYDLLTLYSNQESDVNEALLLTADTGERWEVFGTDNAMKFFNVNEKVVIQMDDTSAVEGTYWTNIPPIVLQPGNVYPKNYVGSKNMGDGTFRYFYGTMGPGISAGVNATDPDGFSTLGRKEIYTNGKIRVTNADETQKTEITKTGITTTGNVDIGAGLNIEGIVRMGTSVTYTGNIIFKDSNGFNAVLEVKNGAIISTRRIQNV